MKSQLLGLEVELAAARKAAKDAALQIQQQVSSGYHMNACLVPRMLPQSTLAICVPTACSLGIKMTYGNSRTRRITSWVVMLF